MTNLAIDLTGQVALVTGASRGIGRETAVLLAEAGASVAINYFRSEAAARSLAESIGDRAFLVPGDVSDPAAAREIVEQTVGRFGRLDTVVNNAATFALNRFDRDDYDGWQTGWQQTFALNVFGAANVSFHALRAMREAGGGTIINIASRAAFRGETEFADYGASKAALVNLTRSIARGCAKHGIRANCVAPGFIATEMAAEEIRLRGPEIVAEIPLARVGTPAEVAAVVVFLASPLASYLNGVTIDVNGGSYLC